MLTALRRQRLLQQCTLYDIKARTGISVCKLSLVERGIERPSDDEKRRLAKALGVRPQEIFPTEEGGNENQLG